MVQSPLASCHTASLPFKSRLTWFSLWFRHDLAYDSDDSDDSSDDDPFDPSNDSDDPSNGPLDFCDSSYPLDNLSYGTKYLRLDQVKFVEDSLQKVWLDMVSFMQTIPLQTF